MMRTFIILLTAMVVINFLIDWPALNQMMLGYEDYILAFGLSALIAPYFAPLLD